MDYKDTLLLPKTTFDMRANLYENEKKSFEKFLTFANKKLKEKKAPSFVLHDGPPYANGHLHIGHALNKILKDTINKTRYFIANNSVNYIPGWDCHGLPIEQQVVEIKLKDKNPTIKEIHDACTEHAKEFVKIQSDEFLSLGVTGDFENPYLTMDYRFEANIYKTLLEVAKNGLLVQRSKPVYWSWAAKSALAEAEVEYEDKEDYSIFVAFKLSDDACKKLKEIDASDEILAKAKAVIWTTTPWTLPANKAIALNKDEMYVLGENGLIVAKKRLPELGEFNIKPVLEFKGDFLENTFAINPLNNNPSQFIVGDHVLMDGGSGLVHTAPGHGEDDYYVCLKYGIEVEMPVGDDGCYDENIKRLMPNAPELLGMHVFKANERILELLGENLVKCSKFIHSYPFCWRTHKPIIYRATKQFFIAMDKEFYNGMTLRELALKSLDNVNFYPKTGKNRIGSMVANRPDWCISRQRFWGVPIAFFSDLSGNLIMDFELYEHIAKIFEKEGVRVWWYKEISELLPANSKYKADELVKITDILDVWFDSGSTFNAVLASGNYGLNQNQADMYLEGSDQHRGWFQSSLLLSVILNKQAPYKAVLTHGFTVDDKGRKMSKSLGNVIAPEQIAKNYGLEIFRLYITLCDYSSDIKLGDSILKQTSEQYRKIRNTIRFLLANTSELKEYNYNFSELDKMILKRAKEVFDLYEKSFLEYDFAKGMNALCTFLSADLSGVYLDVCKDGLYCDKENDPKRQASISAMALILKKLLVLLAPVLTHTINEACEHANKFIIGNVESVFDLENFEFKEYSSKYDYDELMKSRIKFYELIDTLKKDKVIKSTLELDLITNDESVLNYENAADYYLVSKVASNSNDNVLAEFELNNKTYKITKSSMHKCPRCWKYLSISDESLCPRCEEVMR